MDNKPKGQIAISLFTGAIIAFFIILKDLVANFFYEVLVLLILGIFIIISLKVILDPSTDLHFIGDYIKILLNVKNKY